MYERISWRSACARCSCWSLLAAAARSSAAAGRIQELEARRHCARFAALYLSTTCWSATSIAITCPRRSKAAALTAAERALAVFADFSRAFATKKSASVAPIAAAPSVDTAITRATTLRSDERFDDRSEVLWIEGFSDERVGARTERSPLVVGALPRRDDDDRNRLVASPRAQLGQELQPTLAGQQHVEHDRLGLGSAQHLLRLVDVFRLDVAIPVA